MKCPSSLPYPFDIQLGWLNGRHNWANTERRGGESQMIPLLSCSTFTWVDCDSRSSRQPPFRESSSHQAPPSSPRVQLCQLHRCETHAVASPTEGPTLGLMLCCHLHEMLTFWTRGHRFSFCTEPCKLCSQSWSQHHPGSSCFTFQLPDHGSMRGPLSASSEVVASLCDLALWSQNTILGVVGSFWTYYTLSSPSL